ncbi:MAG: 3-dehydroquinate synthase [Verrucomicrobiales bacterium]|nr:3-dehydroquinate synthase [Verrucomicrobiales bacterium]
MITVHVNLAERSYDVLVGDGILSSLGTHAASIAPKNPKIAVVTDSNVAPLYATHALASLREAGLEPALITVPAGEASKSMAAAEDVCRQMIRAGLDRSSLLVALGGGVVGDLAGFVAAIFYRGIPFIQVPTTIVSQVDSSVGGKTGVNAPEGKNLIGSFHQPALVLADTTTLASLPAREFNEGFAEVIKHAAIRDGEMLSQLGPAASNSREKLAPLIARNVSIKARVVEQDERETSGTRALLNFGHTIGHAVESAAGYGTLLHGEAISLGTHAALKLSRELAGLSDEHSQAVAAALDAFQLPRTLPDGLDTDDLIRRTMTDKKFQSGKIRFVLLRSLGDAFVSTTVNSDHLVSAIASLRQ